MLTGLALGLIFGVIGIIFEIIKFVIKKIKENI